MATNIHTDDQHASSHQDGGQDELSLASLSGTPAALATHEADIDVHMADLKQFMQVGRYYEEFGACGSADTGCPGADHLSAAPFTVVRDITIDRISLITAQAGGAGTHARLGIYRDNGDAYPADLLRDFGEVDIEVAAAKYIIQDQALTKGLYWMVVLCEIECKPRYRFWGSHWSPVGINAGQYLSSLNWKKAQAYGALPDPFPSGAAADGHAVCLPVRIKSLD